MLMRNRNYPQLSYRAINDVTQMIGLSGLNIQMKLNI